MKKLFLVLPVLFIFTSLSFSQNFATKGTIEAGGSIGFNSHTTVIDGNSYGDASNTFMVNPYIGYFISNGFELGIIPNFMYQSSGSGSSSTAFGGYIAPAWNFDLRSNLFPFIEGKIGYNTVNSKSTYLGETYEETDGGLAWGVRGGVKVKVGNSALVNLAVSYDQVTMNPSNNEGGRDGYNIFAVNAGFTIFFGR